MKILKKDILIAGGGIAGLCCAIESAENGRSVCVVYKDKAYDNNSYRAQGGVAIPVLEGDSVGRHLHDTIRAGRNFN
ncbi:MAG: FAD-dependent oxidoreductase, partial [Candidatus Muiribacteriaceae bacterium]